MTIEPPTGLYVWPFATEPQWETCVECKQEFVWGYICRRHKLCGVCHMNVKVTSP